MNMRKILLVLLLVLSLCSCSNKQDDIKTITNIEDLNGKNAGFLMGTFQDKYIEENYKNIKLNNTYLNSTSELLLALKANKIDAIVLDEPVASLLEADNKDIYKFIVPETGIDLGFIFSNDSLKIKDDFNEYLREAKACGLIEEFEKKWYEHTAGSVRIEKMEYTPTKQTIKVNVSLDMPPYCYVVNDEIQGFSYEIITDFAYKYGYGIEVEKSSFNAMLASVSSGKYDVGVDGITITEERKKNLIFSDPINSCPIAIVIKIPESINDGEIYNSISQLQNKTLGCMTGSVYYQTIVDKFNAQDIVYFNSRPELLMSLKLGKIDGYIADKPVAISICCQENDIKYIDEPLENVDYGFCFSEDATKIKNQFNEFLLKCNNNGTINRLQEKWISEDVYNQSLDEYNLTGTNGTIHACTSPDAAPFSFYKDNKYQGYEVELAMMFADEYGYDLEITGTNFDSIIAAISTSKYDMAFNGINITEERKKSVDFSNPSYSSSAVAVVRSGESQSTNILETIKNKFNKTFFEEERYKIIFKGIYTTLLITVLSLLFGTIFGFALFLLSRKFGSVFSKTIDSLSYIISRLPVVVLLMILFYIIFAKSSLSGEFISIIGFSVIICNSVYDMLKTGVDAIDKGQFEGALALGYTNTQTLFKFILPQALRIVMPSYRGEIVSLIKSTSIVGYVAVEDLTRASDLIRSRTYDAFFPLIVTAIIYFILASLITKLADKLQRKYLPNEKTKEEILNSIK